MTNNIWSHWGWVFFWGSWLIILQLKRNKARKLDFVFSESNCAVDETITVTFPWKICSHWQTRYLIRNGTFHLFILRRTIPRCCCPRLEHVVETPSYSLPEMVLKIFFIKVPLYYCEYFSVPNNVFEASWNVRVSVSVENGAPSSAWHLFTVEPLGWSTSG